MNRLAPLFEALRLHVCKDSFVSRLPLLFFILSFIREIADSSHKKNQEDGHHFDTKYLVDDEQRQDYENLAYYENPSDKIAKIGVAITALALGYCKRRKSHKEEANKTRQTRGNEGPTAFKCAPGKILAHTNSLLNFFAGL
ncbi:hypothetical protein SAMN05216350_101711 [Polaromonas sp. YR568]|nr:hypothetical protein SAMN05216350_101711 [Polaromonas sp. YR568]